MQTKKPAPAPSDVYENVKSILDKEPRRRPAFRIFKQTTKESNVVPANSVSDGIDLHKWDASSFEAASMFNDCICSGERYWGDVYRRNSIASKTTRSFSDKRTLSYVANGVWPPRLEEWRSVERSYVRAKIIFDWKVRALEAYKRALFDAHLPMSDYMGLYVLLDSKDDWMVFDHITMCDDESMSVSSASQDDIDVTNPVTQIATQKEADEYVRLKNSYNDGAQRVSILAATLKNWNFESMAPKRNAGSCYYVYGDIISITIEGDGDLPTFWPWGRIAFVQEK